MARHHAIPAILILALASLAGPAPTFPADIVIPPTEAPTTIFSTRLGSADVDLSLLGSWTAAASFGTGVLFAPGLPAQVLDAFPSMDQGFIFNQTPDITISLDMFKRFFLNVSVVGSFANNSIQLGYRGLPGEVIRSVILGTQGITLAPSQLLQIPAQPLGSLGAMAEFVSGNSTNDVLLRWDAPVRKNKSFVGKSELVQQEVAVNSYVRGRFFFLPDAGLDTDTLRVFLEDQNGTFLGSDSRKYRTATFDEVQQDSVRGLIYFPNPVKGRVLAYYTKGTAPVGTTAGGALPKQTTFVSPFLRDFSTSQSFTWGMTYLGATIDTTTREISLPGVGNALLLWQPGDNSPFEIDSSYAFQSDPPVDTSRISIKLHGKVAVTLPANPKLFQSDPANKRFLALADTHLEDRTSFLNFYPFPDPDGLLYGPQRDSIAGNLDYDIFYQFQNPVGSYILEANVIPGSVQVLVNNIPETRFQVEPVSGTLTMLADVAATDRIDVTYSVVSSDTTGGDILFAWRDLIHFSDALNVFFSAGLRWNANPWSYSQLPYAKSGTIIATAGISGKTDNLSYSAEGGLSYTNPDTSGILRLFGMEGNTITIDLSEDNAYPAAEPKDWTPFAFTPVNGRGKLFYQDFRLYGALGATTLEPITWPDVPSRLPYADGSRMGPFNVAGSPDSLSTASLNPVSLVMDYDLGANQWVGTQLPVSPGSDVDLSGARTITVRLRGIGLSGTVKVFLQIGSISEDLDGLAGGVPKAEPSSASAGFSFVDQTNLVTLRVGAGPKLTGNGRLDTEDRNANSLVDLDDSSRIVTEAFGSFGATWKTQTFPLDDTARQALMQARGVRIIIVETAASTGTIIIDSLTVEGTLFAPRTAVAADRGQVHIQEVLEALAKDVPSQAFPSAFPSTYQKFHPNSEPNQALETLWGTPANQFSVRGFVPTVAGDVQNQGTGGIQYQTIVSYLRSSVPSGTTFDFVLEDSSSPARGIRWRVVSDQIPTDAWHEIKVSKKNNSVTIDGTVVGSPTEFDSGYGSLTQLTVTISNGSGGAPGTGSLYMDEVYCTDPQGDFGAAFVGTIAARFPGTLVKIGEVAVVSNLAVQQDVSLKSAGFAPLYGTPSPTEDLSSRTHADADLFFTHTSVDLEMREAGGVFSAAGGHKIVIPSMGIPLSFSDAFSLNWAGGFSRENTLGFSPGSFMSFMLATSANADADETADTGLLTQGWQASLTVNPFSTFSVVSSLSLSQALSGYTLAHDWYGARWINESALVIPWAGGAEVLRTEKLDVKAGIPPAPVGFSLEAAADTSKQPDVTTTGFSQLNNVALSAGVQLALGQGSVSDLSMSLVYKRLLSLTTTPGATTTPGPWGGFADQTGDLAGLLSGQGYLLSAFPFVEIFSNNTGIAARSWQDAIQGQYSPSLTLSLQRSFGARLLDLFVPSSVDLAFGQDLKKTTDLTQANIYIRPKISTRAVNLFGQLGAHPLFPRVRTDEYSLSVSGSIDGGTGLPTVLSTLSAEAYASLTGNNENELTLVQTFKRDQTTLPLPATNLTDDTQLLLDWVVRPEKGIVLPLLPAEVGKTGHFAHRESAELTFGYNDTTTYHPLTLVFGHATTLVFEGHGTVKASVNLGMDAENLGASGTAWRFAVRAALEAKLTF